MLCLIGLCLHTPNLFQTLRKALCLSHADLQDQAALYLEILLYDARVHLFDDAHHFVHEWIFERYGNHFVYRPLFRFRICDGLQRGLLVRLLQSACPQFYATKVTDDDNERIRELMLVQLSENRFSSRSRRFAVIYGTEILTKMPEHVGITYVSGIIIFSFVSVDQRLHLVGRLYMMSKGKKLAALLAVLALRRSFYGNV